MQEIGQSNHRRIVYSNITHENNWSEQLPNSNWIVLIICQDKNIETAMKMASTCLEEGCYYMCAVGKEGSWIDDIFDELIVDRRIGKGLPMNTTEDFDSEPMTTWHDSLEEGVWYSIFGANPTVGEGYLKVDNIVCLDMTNEDQSGKIKTIVAKINQGWIP